MVKYYKQLDEHIYVEQRHSDHLFGSRLPPSTRASLLQKQRYIRICMCKIFLSKLLYITK